MAENNEPLEMWAVVEIFGHQKYAGKVSEQSIGGCNFVRLDVPAIEGRRARGAFTKLFGSGAIYSITPVSEAVAIAVASTISAEPVSVYIPADFRVIEAASNDDDGDDDGDG